MWLEVHENNKYELVALIVCCQVCLAMPKVITNGESAKSQEWVELWSYFFACGKKLIEVANLFYHFKWVYSDVSKVIQNNKL